MARASFSLGDHLEEITCRGNFTQTQDLDRGRWTGGMDFLAGVIEHGANFSVGIPCQDGITLLEGAILYQQGGNDTAGFVNLGFDDGTELLYHRDWP